MIDPLGGTLINHRTDKGPFLRRITGPEFLRHLNQAILDSMVAPLVNQQALLADAALTALIEGAENGARDRVFEKGVLMDTQAEFPPNSKTTRFLPAP